MLVSTPPRHLSPRAFSSEPRSDSPLDPMLDPRLELMSTAVPSQPACRTPKAHVNRIGTVLQSKYRIERLLGQGGQGRVYRATHLLLQGTVAVKFLLAQWTQDPVLRARFEREAQLLARFHHPCIVAAHDYGEDAGELFLVMEYVAGQSLEGVLRDHPHGLPPSRVLAISDQILDALAAAHACKITHRDIKPSNILLYQDDGGTERLKLLDFGIATSEAPSCAPRLTDKHQIVGTVLYMPPEQYANHAVGPASDVYSFGLVLYQMLSGRLARRLVPRLEARQGRTVHAPPLRERIDPLALIQHVPEEMAWLIKWALEESPAARPTAAQLRQAMRKTIADLRSPHSSVDTTQVPQSAWSPVRESAPAEPVVENDTGPQPLVALWGFPAEQLALLVAALQRHHIQGISCLLHRPLPTQLQGQPIDAILVKGDAQAVARLQHVRATPGLQATPVLVMDVDAPERVLPLIRAGASDMSVPTADLEQVCRQVRHLLRSRCSGV